MTRSWRSATRGRPLAAALTLAGLALAAGCSGSPAPAPAPAATTGVSSPAAPATPLPTPTRPIRYMPLGDSITEGYGVAGGYRTALWQELVQTDHDRIDFVGSQHSGPPALGDLDHEGHPGWCIDGTCGGGHDDLVMPRIDGWMKKYRPDIVSIHLGTNDLGNGADAATAAARLKQLVGKIYADRPDTYVVLIQIIPMGIKQPEHDAYDALIPSIAAGFQAQGRRIAVSDLSHLLTVPNDYRDALHPTQAGYDEMGRALAPTVQAAYASLVQR